MNLRWDGLDTHNECVWGFIIDSAKWSTGKTKRYLWAAVSLHTPVSHHVLLEGGGFTLDQHKS